IEVSDDAFFDMLDILNPELKAMDASVEELSLSVKLARKRYLPDFLLGVGLVTMAETESGSTPRDTSLTVGLVLPLWRQTYKAGVAEASLARESLVNRRRQLGNNLQVELRKSLFELRDAERQIELLKESAIPRARQAVEVARQEFMSGTTQFMTLVDAQRTLFDFSLMLERSEADREIALGEIGCCVGKYDLGGRGAVNGNEEPEGDSE
ncbi:TolC family protein, partial [Verrucomicrobiota bacterium]